MIAVMSLAMMPLRFCFCAGLLAWCLWSYLLKCGAVLRLLLAMSVHAIAAEGVVILACLAVWRFSVVAHVKQQDLKLGSALRPDVARQSRALALPPDAQRHILAFIPQKGQEPSFDMARRVSRAHSAVLRKMGRTLFLALMVMLAWSAHRHRSPRFCSESRRLSVMLEIASSQPLSFPGREDDLTVEMLGAICLVVVGGLIRRPER